MRLSEIPLSEVFAAKNWRVLYREGEDRDNPELVEAVDFGPLDYGLFSSMVRFADGSEHPALAIKSMELGAEHTDTFVYTRMGWLNLLADGFMRAVGKYSHDVFPFELFVACPWKGDTQILRAEQELHRRTFGDALERLRAIKYESNTGSRRRLLAP